MKGLGSIVRTATVAVLTVFAAEAFVIPTLNIDYGNAEAKSYGSRSSRSSSSSSSWGRAKAPTRHKAPKASSYQKPKKVKQAQKYAKPKTKPSKATTGGYAKPGSKDKKVATAPVVKPKPSAKPPASAHQKKAERKRAAEALKKRQAKLDATRKSNPALSAATKGKTYKPEGIKQTRNNYYERRGVEPSRYRDSRMMRDDRDYGGFDNGFLTTMLFANAMGADGGDAMFWYAMTGSPAMAVIMADAKEEAKTDPALEARIAAIEAENARLKAQGVPQPTVTSQLSEMGVPAEVAFSQEALTGKAELPMPELVVATGNKGGNYEAFCEKLRENAEGAVEVECKNTSGTGENLRLYTTGQVGATLGQSDAIDGYLQGNKKASLGPLQKDLYAEYVFMIANAKGGVDEVSDIGKKHTLYIGPQGSGTAETWAGFVRQDPKHYGSSKVRTQHATYQEAVTKVIADKKAVMLYVGALNADFIAGLERDYGDKLKLVAVNDWDFNDNVDRDGNTVYTFTDVSSDQYPNLQKSFIGSHSVETLTVTAVFALNERWVARYGPEAEEAVRNAVYFSTTQ